MLNNPEKKIEVEWKFKPSDTATLRVGRAFEMLFGEDDLTKDDKDKKYKDKNYDKIDKDK